MQIPKTPGNAQAPVQTSSLTLVGGKKPGEARGTTKYTDEAAKQITTQAATRFATWIQEKSWSLRWHEADILYQSPRIVTAWEGTEQRRANVSDYMVLEYVNSLHPMAVKSFFYQNPPFELKGVPGTDADLLNAHKVLLAHVLKHIKFRAEVSRGLFSQCLMGTVIMKRGWQRTRRIVKKRVRRRRPVTVEMPLGDKKNVPTRESEEFEIQENEVWEEWPFLECCNIEHILVDPDARVSDIREAKAVIDERYVTFKDLDDMRDEVRPDGTPLYNIPDRETLLKFFERPAETPQTPAAGTEVDPEGTATHHAAPRWRSDNPNPTQQPLRLLEYWDKEIGRAHV